MSLAIVSALVLGALLQPAMSFGKGKRLGGDTPEWSTLHTAVMAVLAGIVIRYLVPDSLMSIILTLGVVHVLLSSSILQNQVAVICLTLSAILLVTWKMTSNLFAGIGGLLFLVTSLASSIGEQFGEKLSLTGFMVTSFFVCVVVALNSKLKPLIRYGLIGLAIILAVGALFLARSFQSESTAKWITVLLMSLLFGIVTAIISAVLTFITRLTSKVDTFASIFSALFLAVSFGLINSQTERPSSSSFVGYPTLLVVLGLMQILLSSNYMVQRNVGFLAILAVGLFFLQSISPSFTLSEPYLFLFMVALFAGLTLMQVQFGYTSMFGSAIITGLAFVYIKSKNLIA